MAVKLRQIRLDVVYRSAVHKVGARHLDYGAVGRGESYRRDTHRGKTEIVWAEGRACGKHSLAHVAAKAWRAHGGMLVGIHILRKSPYQPDVIKAVDAPKGFGFAIGWSEDYRARERVGKSALTWYSKL